MKKFLSKITFIAVAVLSATGFASCNNADDDYVGGIVNDKPTNNKVPVYSAYVNENVLNMCDITLTLHSGDKTKVVKLDKGNGTLDKIDYEVMGQHIGSLPAYRFDFDNVDGNKGIDYVEANSTIKPEAEGVIKALDPEKEYYFAACSNFRYEEFMSNGHYSFGKFNTADASSFHSENLLKDNNGEKAYERLPKIFNVRLSKKKPGM